MSQEIELEVSAQVEKILAICDGHSFAINKTALQIARDYMIAEEALALPK